MQACRLRLVLLLSTILAALACVPVRLSREISSFQRELDVELADALEPGAGVGLEAACHRDPISWMYFVADGEDWRLLSVDQAGHAAIWTERGLEQSWPLAEHELGWVRDVVARQAASEDAQWLRARAKAAEYHCRTGLCAPDELADIASSEDHRWVGLLPRTRERRLATSGPWFARGDENGELVVGEVSSDDDPQWSAAGCDRLLWASIGAKVEELVTGGYAGPWDHRRRRRIDLRRGLQTELEHEFDTRYEIDDLDLGRDWMIHEKHGRGALTPLAEVLIDEPELLWQPARMALSADERWVAVADETGWLIRDRVGGAKRRIETPTRAQVVAATISSRGTLALAGREQQRGFIELHPVDGEATTHQLPEPPAALAFVPAEADAEETLWIGLADESESPDPIRSRLLRLEPGGVPTAHAVAGFGEIERVLGRMPVSTPTLVVAGGGVLGIERLTDGAVLRVIVYEPDGLSLIWLDGDGQPRCRYDGGNDDHVRTREPRVADPSALVDAFLFGRGCPG